MFQRYLHDYIKCCFSDMDWHLKELSMFIHKLYVSGELTHMLIGYEIARFGARDVLDIMRIMMLYQFSCCLILNINISMTCG